PYKNALRGVPTPVPGFALPGMPHDPMIAPFCRLAGGDRCGCRQAEVAMTSSQRVTDHHRGARAGWPRRALLVLLPALTLAPGCHPLNLLSRDHPEESDRPAAAVPGAPAKYS